MCFFSISSHPPAMPVFTEKWAHYRCRCYLPKVDPSPLANTAGFLSHSSGWLCCHSNCAEGFVQFHYLPIVHACMPLFPLYPGQATCKHSPGGRAHVRSSSGWQAKRNVSTVGMPILWVEHFQVLTVPGCPSTLSHPLPCTLPGFPPAFHPLYLGEILWFFTELQVEI